MDLKRKRSNRFISMLLCLIMVLTMIPSTAFAGWNSGSNTSGGGGGTASAGAGVSYKDQGLKASLYFCPMDDVIMNGTAESRAAMDKKWAEGTGIVRIGKPIYIGRDNMSFGASYYSGNVAESDLFPESSTYKSARQLMTVAPNGYHLSELGMSQDMPVAIVDSGVPAGKSSTDYFMVKNPNHKEGETAEWDTLPNMRALVHAISGKLPNGKDTVSFSRSEMAKDSFNENSDLDSGTFKGKNGEYKLFLENCITIGGPSGTIMTVRDAVSKGFIDGPNASERKRWQTSTMSKLANGLFLVKEDTFGMTPKGDDAKSSFSDLVSKVNNGKGGYGVSILSSELFRNPKTRSIASHVNVFLSDGDAIGMEYIGPPKTKDELYKGVAEIIKKKLDSYAALSNPTTKLNTVGKAVESMTVVMGIYTEVDKYLKEQGIDLKAVGVESSDIQEFLDSGALGELSVALLFNLMSPQNNGTNIDSVQLSALAYEKLKEIQEEGDSVLSVTPEKIESEVTNIVQGTFLVDAAKSATFKQEQEKYKTQLAQQGASITDAAGLLAPESKKILESSGQISTTKEWSDKLNDLDNKPTQIPVVSGKSMFRVYNNSLDAARIPKGFIKDISTDLLNNIGLTVKEQMDASKEYLYNNNSSIDYVDGKNSVKMADPEAVEQKVMDWLGGVHDGSVDSVYDPTTGETVSERSIGIGDLQSQMPPAYVSALFPNKSGASGSYKYPVITVGKSNDAAYGIVSSDGDIKAINIESLGINHAMEAGLISAPYVGYHIMKPSSFEEYTSGTRPIKGNITGTNLTPSKWLENLDNIDNKKIADDTAAQKAVAEVSNYASAQFARTMDDSYDTSPSTEILAKTLNSGGAQTGTEIQAISNAMLNSVLPSEPSEIGDGNFSRINLKGNYGISYVFYDTAIPIDVVFMMKTKDGKITYLSGDKDAATIVGAYNVTSGIEKALKINENYTIPTKDGKQIKIKPTELIVKPAEADLVEFTKKYSEARDTKQDKVEWQLSSGATSLSKIEKAPFQIKVQDDYRTLQYAGNDTEMGKPTNINADKIVKNAVSVVASEQDKDAYLASPSDNRMAVIILLEGDSSITQYNVIDTIDKDGKTTTEIQKVSPKYSEDGTKVELETEIDKAKLIEWKTSPEDKEPSSWGDVTPLPPSKESKDPVPTIDQNKDEEDAIYVHYEKREDGEPIKADLRLTEKRISWLKSLEDIGGIPTIVFQWNAITGHETHTCGSEHCGGHSCNERIGEDSFLRFVSSNTTSVKSSIMGNTTNFMPYDVDNVHEFNRGNSGGTYDMHPNYGYVIWRGHDIPTIASYKYGDTTGNGVAPDAPVIKGLIGETQVGIAGKETRKADKNNSFYMDGFTITEGKSNYDTGNLTAFVNTFGPQEGMAGDKKFEGVLNQFHDISTRYKIAQGEVEIAKDRMSEDKAYLDRMHGEHDDRRYGHDNSRYYDRCRKCNDAQSDYDESVENYNEKVKIRDGLLDQYNKIAEMLGQNKTEAGEGTANLGDYDYSTSWSYCGKESWYNADGGNQTFAPKVQVDVGFGTAGVGDKKVTFKSTNLAIGSEEWQQVQGFPINNTRTIEFWPYVEMLYDTTTGLTDQKVNVLAGHKSTIVPQDYVEIGYLPKAANGETTTGLLLQSKQWSTHQAALKLAGGAKNKVLPGGAIYRLTTPGGSGAANTRTRIAMSSWLTFLPGDTINATVAGKDVYNGTAQNNKNEALYRQVLRSLNSLDVVQVVNGTQVLQEQAGSQKVPGTSGQPTSKDAKYWLQQNIQDGVDTATNDNAIKINSVKTNEADLDITATAESRIYYRIYSDVEGNVYVSKSTTSQADTAPGKGTVLGSITKTQGLNDLLAKHNEIKALNNRTNIVENYLLSIDRNIGNDVSLTDTKWYNEAFDGICVVRINKVIEVGFKDKDANNAARTSALDPKLQPPRKSQSDMYKTGIKSWFETDKHTNLSNEAGYVGSFDASNAGGGTVKIIIQNMNGIYKSKEFTIPDVSVMNLY